MNRQLVAGLVLLVVLCVFAVFSGSLAPHEEGYSKSINVMKADGEDVLIVAPEAPGPNFVLGSDFWGYDLFSGMLHGLPWTLAIVFVTSGLRCALGLGIGLFLGARGKTSLGSKGFSPLAAMPGFIIAAFVLYPLTINPVLPALALFLIQAAVLTVVEFLPLASSFAAKASILFSKPFVDSAKVSGAGGAWIATRHLLPFLLGDLLEALPVQALAVAAMIGKLGIAKIFIGGTRMSYDPIIMTPTRFEWLGLLGNYYDTMFTQPWLFFAPFAGWLLILACTILLSRGIRLQRRVSALN